MCVCVHGQCSLLSPVTIATEFFFPFLSCVCFSRLNTRCTLCVDRLQYHPRSGRVKVINRLAGSNQCMQMVCTDSGTQSIVVFLTSHCIPNHACVLYVVVICMQMNTREPVQMLCSQQKQRHGTQTQLFKPLAAVHVCVVFFFFCSPIGDLREL